MASDNSQSKHPIPHLCPTPSDLQLMVHGKRFLCLPGELQNSIFSSASYMDQQWPRLKTMNINTVLGAVTWESIEPEEGIFNFVELDKNIKAARRHGLRLVLLWFGSFKNALSTYVPAWVKLNPERFPRAKIRQNRDSLPTQGATDSLKTIEVLSPCAASNWEADAKAFAELMSHVRQIDAVDNTVIMVQVENEPGLLKDSRDRSAAAEHAFASPVPTTLLSTLHDPNNTLHEAFIARHPHAVTAPIGSSWSSAFGKHAEEIFMADKVSKYVGQVAAAGKARYRLPMFVNAWLNCDDERTLDLKGIPLEHDMTTVAGGGAVAGDYPSGGVCPHHIDLYKMNAPALDFVSPDVYLHDYYWVCRQHHLQDNPLFIPEQRRDEHGARRLMLAYGTFSALGCSPFGVDTVNPASCAFGQVFGLLASVESHIHEARNLGSDHSWGFYFDEVERGTGPNRWTRVFGDFELVVEHAFVFGNPGPGAGLILDKGKGKFLLVGYGFRVSFRSADPNVTFTGILSAVEKEVDQFGELRDARVLNGDETRGGECVIMPNDKPDEGGFPIAITISARTYIAECTAYSIFG